MSASKSVNGDFVVNGTVRANAVSLPDGEVESGEYSPTVDDLTGFAALGSPYTAKAKWTRVGRLVTVDFFTRLSNTATTVGFSFTLPSGMPAAAVTAGTIVGGGTVTTGFIGTLSAYATSNAVNECMVTGKTNYASSAADCNVHFQCVYAVND